MKHLLFRQVRLEDAASILSIYAPYILNTPITFEYDVPSLTDFTTRIRQIIADYPYFVCELDGKIIGYAYAHRHQERAAYQWNAEISIYIQEEYTRLGLGKIMCSVLMKLLRLQNIRNVYSCVTVPNPKSEYLHHSLGFQTEGIFRCSGYKCGKWHDVAWFRKGIADYINDPTPFLSISEVEQILIDRILQQATEEGNLKMNR